MPYMEEHENATGTQSSKEPKKLILCFDGTGNTFSGSNADTNVVKLLSKLDRNHPDQFHYYQTGIGTYGINETSVNKTWLGEIKSSMSKALDQGFGTTFDAHVIAGYRFLMRYYVSGAKIYIFGFSRGAFTAKFLARMINKVGLLCKGNEEMVPFAYLLYQRYLSGHIQDRVVAQQKQRESHPETTEASDTETESLLQGPDGTLVVEDSHQTELALNEITAFSQTFCRKETRIQTTPDGKTKEAEENIKVYFLGIWDCVNSVAVLEKKTPVPVPVTGTAHFVRHAVSVDERRVKFKPALLAMDRRASENIADEDIKEVWFPGNHGDVGGGWPSVADNPLDNNKSDEMTFWQRIKNFCLTRKAKEASKNIDSDRLQMSDIPLAWMIRELELVGMREPTAAVKWCKSVELFKKRFKVKKEYALKAFMHDTLSFGYGLAFFKVLMWKFMEYLPLINRWELKENGWVNVRFPLNKGSTRDIPTDAELHESLIWRLRNVDSYNPKNNHGDDLPPCLKYDGKVADVEKILQTEGQPDPDHQTYRLVQNK